MFHIIICIDLDTSVETQVKTIVLFNLLYTLIDGGVFSVLCIRCVQQFI